MGLKVDRDYMTRKFRQLSGTDEELILPRQLDLSTSHWRGWVNLLHALAAQPTGQDDLLRSEVVAEQLSGAITDSFLAGLISMAPHDRDVSPARPRQVKRVLDAIHGQPARSWTLSDMAEVAEVSGRRLQQSFKETVGLSPIEYLRDLRLALVHQDLLENVENASVHEVAARWGFLHAGRFSLFYKQKYGRLPSQVFRNR